jgi:hypothetical protein
MSGMDEQQPNEPSGWRQPSKTHSRLWGVVGIGALVIGAAVVVIGVVVLFLALSTYG